MRQERKPMIPHRLAMTALRDSGYRNTAYAIAELIDNSVQAGAHNIELLCCDRVVPINKQERRTIHQIAVADDGCGMSKEVLENSLQYGNGTRLEDRSGIGRFGVGLLNSSISQGKLVEVYTWKDNQSPLYSYAAVEDDDEDVPIPTIKEINGVWKQFSECVLRPSGTLVIWSELDRCRWRKSSTIIDRSEDIIGRIYRNLISKKEGGITINAISFTDPATDYEKREIKVNDPCYLLVPSSTPKPFNNEAMFIPDGDGDLVESVIKDGKMHEIHVKFSLAKSIARKGIKRDDAGDEPWGKHAAGNVGISLMRSNRELELTTALNIDDTRERWWGVEVSFPPALDEMFGVTSNKQSATNFVELATAVRSKKQTSEKEEGDDKELLRVIEKINKRIAVIRKRIARQKKDKRKENRHSRSSEDRGTEAVNDRKEAGHVGTSDKSENEPDEYRVEDLSKTIEMEERIPKSDADIEAKKLVSNKLKFKIIASMLPGSTLVDIQPSSGVLIVKINQNHPAYNNLIEVTRDIPENLDNVGELKERLQRASNGLELLLLSWARFEDEAPDLDELRRRQDIRISWGRFIADFLEKNQ